jgi:hypothetical protein
LTLSSNSASTSLQLTKHAADNRTNFSINLWTHGHLKLVSCSCCCWSSSSGAVIDSAVCFFFIYKNMQHACMHTAMVEFSSLENCSWLSSLLLDWSIYVHACSLSFSLSLTRCYSPHSAALLASRECTPTVAPGWQDQIWCSMALFSENSNYPASGSLGLLYSFSLLKRRSCTVKSCHLSCS